MIYPVFSAVMTAVKEIASVLPEDLRASAGISDNDLDSFAESPLLEAVGSFVSNPTDTR